MALAYSIEYREAVLPDSPPGVSTKGPWRPVPELFFAREPTVWHAFGLLCAWLQCVPAMHGLSWDQQITPLHTTFTCLDKRGWIFRINEVHVDVVISPGGTDDRTRVIQL